MDLTAGDCFYLFGARISVLAADRDTAGAWEMIEVCLPPGARTMRQSIASHQLVYVVEGTLRIRLGQLGRSIEAGAWVHVPAATAYSLRGDPATGTRLTVTVTGHGHVDFLRGLGRLTGPGSDDLEALVLHTLGHGVSLWPDET